MVRMNRKVSFNQYIRENGVTVMAAKITDHNKSLIEQFWKTSGDIIRGDYLVITSTGDLLVWDQLDFEELFTPSNKAEKVIV